MLQYNVTDMQSATKETTILLCAGMLRLQHWEGGGALAMGPRQASLKPLQLHPHRCRLNQVL